MKISVAIFVYKNFDLIDDLLSSLNKQSDNFHQLIISSDDPDHKFHEEIDKKLRIFNKLKRKELSIYQNKENIGIVKHVSKVLTRLSGELVLLIGADDYIEKNYFKKIYPYFNQLDVMAVTPNQYRVSEKGLLLSASSWTQGHLKGIAEQILKENFGIPPAGTLIRRHVLEKASFTEDMLNEDEQFYFLCNLLGQRKIIPDCLFYYRVSKNSMSSWLRNPWVRNISLKSRLRLEFLNRVAQNEGWLMLLSMFPHEEKEQALKNIENNISSYHRKIRDIENTKSFLILTYYRFKIFWTYFKFEIRKMLYNIY